MHVRYGSVLNLIGVEMEMRGKCDLELACFRPDLFFTRPSRSLAIHESARHEKAIKRIQVQ